MSGGFKEFYLAKSGKGEVTKMMGGVPTKVIRVSEKEFDDFLKECTIQNKCVLMGGFDGEPDKVVVSEFMIMNKFRRI